MKRADKDILNRIVRNIDEVRFCNSCNKNHGRLYICPNYTQEVKKEVENENRIWLEFLTDEKLIRKAVANGVSGETIMFWQIFAGVVH